MHILDWKNNAERNFNQYWPGWDRRICETGAKEKYNIKDIGTVLQY